MQLIQCLELNYNPTIFPYGYIRSSTSLIQYRKSILDAIYINKVHFQIFELFIFRYKFNVISQQLKMFKKSTEYYLYIVISLNCVAKNIFFHCIVVVLLTLNSIVL
jgi:hypothetical protein